MLARRYDVSVDALVAVNDLEDPDLLYVGQRILLPDQAQAAAPDAKPPLEPTPAATLDPTMPMPSLASPDEIIEGRWIDVDLSEQRLTAYEASVPVRTTLVSTGLPSTPTPVGQFRIWIKFRYDDMAGSDYYIEDVPYVMYFHEGYGLHGVTWHANFGHPMSHGCVNLPTSEAEWLFNWADVGTLVNVRE
jgi:lipoprotein-anchoring transpeptidase ErfK/SrfK